MAIGLGTLGFLKGASGVALDSIQQREEEERDARKAEMLEQLRRETAKYLADYEDLLNSKRVDDRLTEEDLVSGRKTFRNSKGEIIGEGIVSQSDREKFSLDREATRANIDQSRAAAQYSRSMANRLDREAEEEEEPDESSIDARAQELLYQNKSTVEDLEKYVAPEVINKMAIEVVAQAAARRARGSNVSLQDIWNGAVSRIRQNRKRALDAGSTADWIREPEVR